MDPWDMHSRSPIICLHPVLNISCISTVQSFGLFCLRQIHNLSWIRWDNAHEDIPDILLNTGLLQALISEFQPKRTHTIVLLEQMLTRSNPSWKTIKSVIWDYFLLLFFHLRDTFEKADLSVCLLRGKKVLYALN